MGRDSTRNPTSKGLGRGFWRALACYRDAEMRRALLVVTLVVAFAPGPSAWAGPHPRPRLERARVAGSAAAGTAGCDKAKATARAELGAERCTGDADCVPFEQDLLGCDGWRDARAALPELARALVRACTGVPSRGAACREQVGACIEGRCRARPRAGGACTKKIAKALLDRAGVPVTCGEHRDCGLFRIGDDVFAVGRDFTGRAAAALHAFAEACDEPAVPVDDAAGAVWCSSGVCRLENGGRQATLVKPRLSDPNCALTTLVHREELKTLPPTDAQVRFVVTREGRAGAFSFSEKTPALLEQPIVEAVLGCAVVPGAAAGSPVVAPAVLPLRIRP